MGIYWQNNNKKKVQADKIRPASYNSFQWVSTNDSNTHLHVLLIKDNQLKIQAIIKENRQKAHLHISEDTFGCKGQKTNTE